MEEKKEKEDIEQAVEEFSEEQKKFEIALAAANGDRELAEKYISGEIKNIAAVKGAFKDDSVNLYGVFIFFIDLDQRVLDRIFATVSFNESIKTISPYSKWPDLERNLIDFEWSGKSFKNQSSDLINGLQSNITHEYMEELIDCIENKKENEVKNILNEIICRSLSLKLINLDVGIELLNKYLIDLEKPEEKNKPVEESDEEEIAVSQTNEIILDGTLVIDPIKGVSISKLVEGMDILIRLPDKTDKDKYYLNLFNAYDDEKVKSIQAKVRSVDFDEMTGYLVIAEVMPGFVVKCIEQAQINVMTHEIAEKDTKDTKGKGRKLIIFIIIIGGFILLFLAVYIFLYFKDII